ncbi:uncharacterized protein EDB91DRAFT_1102771, partial [Suillus paluster]|uniref:uncharacterized protein n=1 Tax=Suillus paluster TaxID=48578 RepID=UPI001B875A8C
DLWTRTGDQKILIRRPVTTADWSVFERYSSRVQILGDTDSDILGGIDAEFIYAVMSFCSQSLLVPNLQVLYCRGYPRDLHLCMRYLLGSNLIYLCLLPPSGDFWTSSMSSVLSGLGRHSPRLEVVEVIQCQVPPNVAELALCGFPHLRKASLVLPNVGDSSWLSRLVGLQELYIHFAGLFFPVLKYQLRTCTLDKLVIGSRNLTITATIVEEWVVPCRELQLNCTCAESAVAFENALRSLDNRLLCDVLERILLDVGNLDEHIDNFFTLRTFTPLMRFSGLKEVDLSSLCISLLDDHALGSIVESWPRLECLHLGTKYLWKTPPKITFRGFVTVLSSCPDLRELGLVFNAKKVDPPTDEKPGGGICNTNITTFDVGFSPIEKPLPVAIALSAILPYLRKIDVEFGPRNTDLKAREAKWREVLEHIRVCMFDTAGLEFNVMMQRRSIRRATTYKDFLHVFHLTSGTGSNTTSEVRRKNSVLV